MIVQYDPQNKRFVAPRPRSRLPAPLVGSGVHRGPRTHLGDELAEPGGRLCMLARWSRKHTKAAGYVPSFWWFLIRSDSPWKPKAVDWKGYIIRNASFTQKGETSPSNGTNLAWRPCQVEVTSFFLSRLRLELSTMLLRRSSSTWISAALD